ncbi:hypothetical protein GQX74_003812 [Glossina fuscipes]|nr:hypothetical protein GQX74_003812 [Glossina fuscipes]
MLYKTYYYICNIGYRLYKCVCDLLNNPGLHQSFYIKSRSLFFTTISTVLHLLHAQLLFSVTIEAELNKFFIIDSRIVYMKAIILVLHHKRSFRFHISDLTAVKSFKRTYGYVAHDVNKRTTLARPRPAQER